MADMKYWHAYPDMITLISPHGEVVYLKKIATRVEIANPEDGYVGLSIEQAIDALLEAITWLKNTDSRAG